MILLVFVRSRWCWIINETHDIESGWDLETCIEIIEGLFEPSIVEFGEFIVIEFVFDVPKEQAFLLAEFEPTEDFLDSSSCLVRATFLEDSREVYEFPNQTATHPRLNLNDSIGVFRVIRFTSTDPMQRLQRKRFDLMHGFLHFILEKVSPKEYSIRSQALNRCLHIR